MEAERSEGCHAVEEEGQLHSEEMARQSVVGELHSEEEVLHSEEVELHSEEVVLHSVGEVLQ